MTQFLNCSNCSCSSRLSLGTLDQPEDENQNSTQVLAGFESGDLLEFHIGAASLRPRGWSSLWPGQFPCQYQTWVSITVFKDLWFFSNSVTVSPLSHPPSTTKTKCIDCMVCLCIYTLYPMLKIIVRYPKNSGNWLPPRKLF